jgi:alkaline phosphatase
MDHSGEFVELAMLGPGSKALPPFVKNTDLHNFMLKTTGLIS